eukprot:225299-Rhodomonas_salina.1
MAGTPRRLGQCRGAYSTIQHCDSRHTPRSVPSRTSYCPLVKYRAAQYNTVLCDKTDLGLPVLQRQAGRGLIGDSAPLPARLVASYPHVSTGLRAISILAYPRPSAGIPTSQYWKSPGTVD